VSSWQCVIKSSIVNIPIILHTLSDPTLVLFSQSILVQGLVTVSCDVTFTFKYESTYHLHSGIITESVQCPNQIFIRPGIQSSITRRNIQSSRTMYFSVNHITFIHSINGYQNTSIIPSIDEVNSFGSESLLDLPKPH